MIRCRACPGREDTRIPILKNISRRAIAIHSISPNRKRYTPEVKVNWGKVFAFILRQPLLAQKLGMIYSNVSIALPAVDFYQQGGWLYIDFAPGSDFFTIPNNDQYIQRYAARIPALTAPR